MSLTRRRMVGVQPYPEYGFQPSHHRFRSGCVPPPAADSSSWSPTAHICDNFQLAQDTNARDIIPVALTTIPTAETAEFQPYLLQVGTLYDQAALSPTKWTSTTGKSKTLLPRTTPSYSRS